MLRLNKKIFKEMLELGIITKNEPCEEFSLSNNEYEFKVIDRDTSPSGGYIIKRYGVEVINKKGVVR